MMVSNTGIPGESVRSKADRLVNQLRDSVLQSNSGGEFAKIGINPLIFAPDFEGRVQSLVSLLDCSELEVRVAYFFQRKMNFVNGYLRVSIEHDKNSAEQTTVDLISFSPKVAGEQFLVDLLPKLETVLQDFFPDNLITVVNQGKSLAESCQIPSQTCSPVRRRKPCDSKLSEALKKYESERKIRDLKSVQPTNAYTAEVVSDNSTPTAQAVVLPVAVPIGAATVEKSVMSAAGNAKTGYFTSRQQQKIAVVVFVAAAFFLWFRPASPWDSR